MGTASLVLKGLTQLPDLWVAQMETPVAHKLVASYLKVGTTRFPLDIPLRDGGLVRVFTTGEAKVFWQIFVRRCYRLWADCKTIVDAGANIGMFSVWAGRRLPESRILAVEPSPETFAKLQFNVRLNNMESRVNSVQLALAAQSGERSMSVGPESQRRRLIAADTATGSEKSVPVPAVSLADLLDRFNLERIDLLKMDIEGSEWEVLHSTPLSVLRLIRRIEFEYHEVHERFGYSPEKLFDYLESAGFKLTHRQEDKNRTGIAMVEQTAWC